MLAFKSCCCCCCCSNLKLVQTRLAKIWPKEKERTWELSCSCLTVHYFVSAVFSVEKGAHTFPLFSFSCLPCKFQVAVFCFAVWNSSDFKIISFFRCILIVSFLLFLLGKRWNVKWRPGATSASTSKSHAWRWQLQWSSWRLYEHLSAGNQRGASGDAHWSSRMMANFSLTFFSTFWHFSQPTLQSVPYVLRPFSQHDPLSSLNHLPETNQPITLSLTKKMLVLKVFLKADFCVQFVFFCCPALGALTVLFCWLTVETKQTQWNTPLFFKR